MLSARPLKQLRQVFVIAVAAIVSTAFLSGCQTSKDAAPIPFVQKLPPPRPFNAKASTPLSPFEQQCRLDTGETSRTRRSELDWPLRIEANSKYRYFLRFDLSAWPADLRPDARLWVSVGASNSFTTDVAVNLTFSQGGTE